MISWHRAPSVHPGRQRAVDVGHSLLEVISGCSKNGQQNIVAVVEVNLLRLGKRKHAVAHMACSP